MNEPSLQMVVSPDTERAQRVPPGQVQTRKWPVLHAGSTPRFDRAKWTFHIFGLVEQPWQCTYDEFMAVPRVSVLDDMHCVTRWSKLDNMWEGVNTREVLRRVNVLPAAKFVMVHCEYGFTTNLPLDDYFGEDCLFAFAHNGQPLEPDHGYPVRLVVPGYYGTYWVKHLSDIQVIDQVYDGFWMKPAYRVPDNACACVEPGSAPAATRPIGRFNVRSFITSIGDGARVPAGQALAVRGIAFDGGQGIREVAWSADGGQSWREATLGQDLGRFSFREFTFGFTPQAGAHDLRVRAFNRSGESQPMEALWQPSGYMRNVVESVRIQAS